MGVDDSWPINSIYIQYPSQTAPETLFPFTTWTEITDYAGAFFRANGGNSASFGTKQNEGLPNIKGFISIRQGGKGGYYRDLATANASGALQSDSPGEVPNLALNDTTTSAAKNIKFDASQYNDIYNDSNYHVTPENYSIKIWKRTA